MHTIPLYIGFKHNKQLLTPVSKIPKTNQKKLRVITNEPLSLTLQYSDIKHNKWVELYVLDGPQGLKDTLVKTNISMFNQFMTKYNLNKDFKDGKLIISGSFKFIEEDSYIFLGL